jgi:hypothetical protein
MSNNAYLRDENILTILSLNNLIIPEIQRDYVWGANIAGNKVVLTTFLRSIKKAAQICESCGYSHSSTPLNVGFLYSYKPPYLSNNRERQLDEFVIDGQQRITTIFLLLLCRAVIEGRMSDFLNICRYNEDSGDICFNYKVRGLTQQFIRDLLNFLGETPQSDMLNFLRNGVSAYPSWILKDYQNDVTTSSMINTMRVILEEFGEDKRYYYDFILNSVRFWHFKTEATSQGEELYITMNSRGVHLQSNETQKASVLPSDRLYEYGKKWEELQDFFWKHRGNNENADTGFNNYISCLAALKRFKMQLDNNNVNTSLNINDIELGVEALEYLTSSEDLVRYLSDHNIYASWFEQMRKDIWSKLNGRESDWNIPIDKKGFNNARQQRINSMLLWGWIYYYSKVNGVVNIALAIDILHFYYVRYLCKKRSSQTIFKIIDRLLYDNEFRIPFDQFDNSYDEDYDESEDSSTEQMSNDSNISKRYSNEEKLIYATHKGDVAIKSLIWELQDLPIFRDGCEYGSLYTTDTCLSLLDKINTDGKLISADKDKKLQILRDSISILKAIGIYNSKSPQCTHLLNLLRSLMLFYSDKQSMFWVTESPWYYRNHGCYYWIYIVRSTPFLKIFHDLLEQNILNDNDIELKLKEWLKAERAQFFNNNVINNQTHYSDRKIVIIYDAILSDPDGSKIWKWELENDAKRIIFYPNVEFENPLFENQDSLYISDDARYLKNGKLITLPADWQKRISEKYPTQ